MKIYALSGFDTIRKVDVKELRHLIAEGKISAFKRRDGWAIVGMHPIRGDGGDYGGPERREIVQNPLPGVVGMHYCVLPKK
jgi:hypothetical protein